MDTSDREKLRIITQGNVRKIGMCAGSGRGWVGGADLSDRQENPDQSDLRVSGYPIMFAFENGFMCLLQQFSH